MAAYVQNVITFNTTAGAKTAIITPAVNGLLVVTSAASGTIATPTLTDNQTGGTYSLILAPVRSSSASGGWLWVRDNLAASAVAHTLTFTPSADTGGGLNVFEFSGMTRAGTSAVRQSVKQDNQSAGTTPAPVFGSAVLTSNPVVCMINALLNQCAVGGPGGTFTVRQDAGYTTPANGLETATSDSGFTGTTVTWGTTCTAAWCDAAVELDTSATAAPGPVRLRTSYPHEAILDYDRFSLGGWR